MVFVNTIGGILHTCVHRWSGVANKNIGDSFLLLWKLPEPEVGGRGSSPSDIAMKKSDIADRALLSFIKFLAEIRRSEDMKVYESHYKIAERFPDYEVKLGLSLHAGWAIEGPIGSDFKVDASYLSPHVNLCMSLGSLTKTYGVSLLLSERIYTLLSLRTKERIRKVDVVKFESKP